MTGLFGVLDPLWAMADGIMAGFPAAVRLLIWGALAGVGSMLIYCIASPQRRLRALAGDARTLRRALRAGDSDPARQHAQSHRMLKTAIARVGLTVLPTLLSALPILLTIAFLDGQYGLTAPAAGTPVAIVTGDGRAIDVAGGQRFAAGWTVAWPDADSAVRISDASGRQIFTLTANTRAGRASVRNHTALLFGARAGELPPESLVSSLTIETTPRSILQPELIVRYQWLVPFLFGLVITSLLVKSVFRIH